MLSYVAKALSKRLERLEGLVVVFLNRPHYVELIKDIRHAGAVVRLTSDGDIVAAVAPSLPDSGVDPYCGIGGRRVSGKRG